ncbi:MAG: hypothetical protein M1483_02640 [Actinobacteria bacterium]|nr:hypothetical protein [Actinomycetota bacterium]MCL6104523.1 hypothetical protein [Actinomycetota bacterium]
MEVQQKIGHTQSQQAVKKILTSTTAIKVATRTIAITALFSTGFILVACGNFHSVLSKARSQNEIQSGAITQTWLSKVTKQWQPVQQSKLIFSPTFIGMGYDNLEFPPYNNKAVLQKELTMLEQTGAQGITIDLGFGPWLKHDQTAINLDTYFINKIRSSGHLLFIKDAAAEVYRHNKLGWKQFETAWIKRVRTIAALYHPDYYTVIKEPGWYAPMIAGLSRNINSPADKQVISVSAWATLLNKLATTVKQVSPNTKVGICIPGDSLYHGKVSLYVPLMNAASHMADVNYLGFDIYDTTAFEDTLRFLRQNGTNGKAIWINEAWDSTSSTTQTVNPARSKLDVNWIKVLYQYALYIHAQGVSPFFTNFFASYAPLPTTTQGALSFFSKRTPVFYEFQKITSLNSLSP